LLRRNDQCHLLVSTLVAHVDVFGAPVVRISGDP
jgi:hypothetical protein